jgi:hypothetical protein
MGYNHAAAFLPVLPRPKFFPPFEDVVNPTPIKELLFPAINKGKNEAMLLNLREDWIRRFICHLTQDNDNAPTREWAIKWLDRSGTFPKTADQLISGINNPSEIQRAALACLDAWHAL